MSNKKVYYGIGKTPKGKKKATQKQSIKAGQVRRWGLKQVSPEMLAKYHPQFRRHIINIDSEVRSRNPKSATEAKEILSSLRPKQVKALDNTYGFLSRITDGKKELYQIYNELEEEKELLQNEEVLDNLEEQVLSDIYGSEVPSEGNPEEYQLFEEQEEQEEQAENPVLEQENKDITKSEAIRIVDKILEKDEGKKEEKSIDDIVNNIVANAKLPIENEKLKKINDRIESGKYSENTTLVLKRIAVISFLAGKEELPEKDLIPLIEERFKIKIKGRNEKIFTNLAIEAYGLSKEPTKSVYIPPSRRQVKTVEV